MKKYYALMLFLISFCAYSQEAAFMDKLIFKKIADFSDLTTLFCYLTQNDSSGDFNDNVRDLRKIIKYFPKDYSKDKNLTVGDFSLIAIQYLRVESGLFYLATRSGRYATRELVNRKVIPFNTSEYDYISGLDLISYLQKVVGYEESVKD